MASSVTRKNRTRLPRPHASTASAVARCVFPVPLPPIRSTFSRRSMYSHRISSRISGLFTDGAAAKSNASSALGVGNRAAFSRRAAARRSRSSSSSSQSWSRNPRWSTFSLAHRAGHLLALGRHRRQLQRLEVVLQQHRARGLELLHGATPAVRLA